MAVHLETEYLVGLVGLAVGAVAGFIVAARAGRPGLAPALILGAGAAHVVLVPVVEPMREVLFFLYFVAMTAVFVLAIVDVRLWRLGAIVFPLGSIAGYFYFAFAARQADYVGLAIKVVELAVIVIAVASFAATRSPALERRSPA